MEKEYQVVSVSRWQKDGEILGWSYECVLPKLRFEKMIVKIGSVEPVVTLDELKKNGIATVTSNSFSIKPLGRANGQFVSYGLSATADSAVLLTK